MRFPASLTPSFSSPLILWCLNVFWKELHIYHEPLTELLWASTSSSQSLPLCKYNVKCASAQLFRETLFWAAYWRWNPNPKKSTSKLTIFWLTNFPMRICLLAVYSEKISCFYILMLFQIQTYTHKNLFGSHEIQKKKKNTEEIVTGWKYINNTGG